MGVEQSSLPPRPLGFEYFCIAFRPTDKIRIIYGTDHEISIIRQTIEQTWPRGIQRAQFLLNGVHEFKLKGNPFHVYTSGFDAAASRSMAGNILQRLQRDGWKLLVSSDLTRTNDLTTWIFKKVPSTATSSRPLLIVGLSSTDSLMVLNAPEELHDTFKGVVDKSWSAGIQKWKYKNNVLVIKLLGTPWHPDGQQTVSSRFLLQNLIHDLYLKQWKLYGNSNLKDSTNTLFFEYDANMTPEEQRVSFFTISLNKEDRLRLIGAPDNLVSIVRDVIQTSWSRGIQNEGIYGQSWEFKLRGTPWWASGTEAVDSRYLMAKLLETLQSYGWNVVASIDSSRKLSDKSSLVFTNSQPVQSPVFCLSLNESDKLRIINAPPDLQKIFQDLVQTQWVMGVQRIQPYGNSLEIKLRGNPWDAGVYDHDGIHGRSLLCHLFQAFASRQWRPITSADFSAKYVHQKNGPDYSLDVHSFLFTYDTTVVQHNTAATGFPASTFQPTGYLAIPSQTNDNPVQPLQGTGYPDPPFQGASSTVPPAAQIGGYPMSQYGFTQPLDRPPPYEPSAYDKS